MSEQLFLAEPRHVLASPGLGLHLDFAAESAARVERLLAHGGLTAEGLWYDAVAGHWMGQPSPTLQAMAAASYDLTTASAWSAVATTLNAAAQPVDWLSHHAAGAWSLIERSPAPLGQGRYLAILTYDTAAEAGGVGTGSPLVVEFGGVWRLELHRSGQAVLQEVARDSATLLPVRTTCARFPWLVQPDFSDRDGILHWLWIYECRSRLVIRNLAPGLGGQRAGVVWYDRGAVLDPELVEPAGQPVRHALRAAPWRLSGSGYVALNLSPQAFVPGASRLAMPPTRVLGGSLQRSRGTGHGAAVGRAVATLTVRDEHGNVWPGGSGTLGEPRQAVGWDVEWTTTASDTFCLTAVNVAVPPSYRADGNVGTDVIAVAGVADKQVQVFREGDLTRERLSARLLAMDLNLASYCQSNLLVRYVVDGVTRFRGLTNRATWTVARDSTQPTGYLDLEAEGLWRRFRKALWPGGQAFDGRLLTDCLADLLAAAGLASTDYELAACSFVFPKPPDGEAPALVFRAGTSVDRILEELAAKWYGRTLRHYFRLSDGKFVLAYTTAGSSVASFYETSAAAVTAGVPYQTIRAGSYQETLDDSEMYNAVTVVGQDSGGNPLLAKAVDWASINDSAVWNYVGEPWQLVVIDPALCTQAAVNFVCRSLFDRHRYPRIHAQWNSLRVDLFPGDVVTLVGPSYGDTYIIRGVALDKSTAGAGAAPAGIASYAAELIRTVAEEGGGEEGGGGDPEPDPGGGGGEEPPGGGGVTPG
ncbi:MAG: hypothetical protein IT204_20200 [Fimbriimonadaceae bacterium]|nr:hypothetical protein [Fimbriimonadaceae bacterium]